MPFEHFIPHGACLLWNKNLILVYVLGQLLIFLSYMSIPASLLWIAKQSHNLRFRPVLLLFGAFIFLCGGGHLWDVVVVWWPQYWLKAWWDMTTGVVSVLTAALLAPEAMKLLRKVDVA